MIMYIYVYVIVFNRIVKNFLFVRNLQKKNQFLIFIFLQCYIFVEEYEELVEKYWYFDFVKNKGIDFFMWLCIDNVKGL